MKLLIVTQAVDQNHSNLGFFVRWIEEFAKHCDEVLVIANEVGQYSLPENVTVFSLGKEGGSSRLARYVKFLSLIVWFSGRYDSVFCHMNPEYVIAGSWWWVLRQTQVVLWYVHGTVSMRLRFALALVNKAATVNAESLLIKSQKIAYLGHGIDTEYYKPGDRHQYGEYLILTAGRVTPSKRLELLIEALSIAKNEGVPLRASIIGGGGVATDSAYVDRVELLAKIEDIRYLGPQSSDFVREAVSTADIFLNASTTNSVDKAVLEAMAGGTIPITTNRAFRPILEPLGLFVEEGTAVAMAAKIREVLARPDFASLRVQVREEVIHRHNLPALARKLLSLYNS